MNSKEQIAAPLEWIQDWRVQRTELECHVGRMTLVLSAPVAPNPEWWYGVYYNSHQIYHGWRPTRQEAEACVIKRAREWVAATAKSLAAIAQAFEGLEGLQGLEPGDPCPNDCGETLLASSLSGYGRVACDKCQTYWD